MIRNQTRKLICNISVIYYVWVMIKKIRVISEDNQLTRTSNLFEFLFLFRTMLHPAVRDSFNFFLIPFEILKFNESIILKEFRL